MTQIDQQFLDTIQDLADYGIGSLLSGGGSHPDTNHFGAWADMKDRMISKSCRTIKTWNSINLWW